ncbi:hypothetical protein HDU92_007318 [Lobulomyces angularis]|nr:hypothetical protein HDU92_007318 [Lobulomyces angularis]
MQHQKHNETHMGIEQLLDNQSYFDNQQQPQLFSRSYSNTNQNSPSYNLQNSPSYSVPNSPPYNQNHHYLHSNLNNKNKFLQSSYNENTNSRYEFSPSYNERNSQQNNLSNSYNNHHTNNQFNFSQHQQPATSNFSHSLTDKNSSSFTYQSYSHENFSVEQSSNFTDSACFDISEIDSYLSQQGTPPQQSVTLTHSHPIPIKFEQNQSPHHQLHPSYNKISSLQSSSPPQSPKHMSINTSITSIPSHVSFNNSSNKLHQNNQNHNNYQQAVYPSPNSANSTKLSPIANSQSYYMNTPLNSNISSNNNNNNNNNNSTGNTALNSITSTTTPNSPSTFFICDFIGCNKSFNQLKNLKSHKRCHADKLSKTRFT